jgi:GH25 family lysozyme M1 (1,4-beta-N-acetylmuramidase)
MGVTRKTTVALLALALALGGAARAQAALAPGIDVSHWQGPIDWLGVVGAGHTFVFAKATEGASVIDPTYPINRAGAAGTGMRLGAYHFARPAGSGDAGIVASAVAQADYFLGVAAPRSGDLPPVLDLEATGSLAPAALAAWTQAWLDQVEARTGVKAVIYGSPNFWQTKLANSASFAFAGYPLWVAHWTKDGSPLVPAGNWAGRGWTFWQWSDCLSIPGVTSRCTDGDRFNGPNTATGAIVLAAGGAPSSSLAPLVVGTPQAGKLLAAVPGRWNGAKPVAFAYQWQRCDAAGAGCVPVSGATGETYTPTAADAGHALVVAVTAQGPAGSAAALSRPTVAVAASGAATGAAPVAVTLPSVAGTPQAGQTLTASAGGWTGSPTSFGYQWRRCDAAGGACEAIAGAASPQYLVSPAEIGSTLSLVVTATGRGGSRSATAPATSVVAAAPVTETAVASGTVQPGTAGAVATADRAATVSWQPGTLPPGTIVALAPATAKLPLAGTVVRLGLSAPPAWPLDLTYATAAPGVVVGTLPGAGVWQAVPELPAPVLPAGQNAGSYRDSAGALHVLLRAAGQVALFRPGAWGDPRRVPTVRPTLQQLVSAPLRATRRPDGSLRILTRLYASSQVRLSASLLGTGVLVRQGSRLGLWLHGPPARTAASELEAPGTFPVRLTIARAGATPPRLRVVATDPYGRRSTVVLRLRVG